MDCILITGGCGYIGSHLAQFFNKIRLNVVVIDDLSTGYLENKLDNVSYEFGSLSHKDFLSYVFQKYKIKTVMHLAAKTSVEDSEKNVSFYYHENFINTIFLIQTCLEYEVKNFIFSSSAAVYGEDCLTDNLEEDKLFASHVYGRTKYFSEMYMKDIFNSSNMNFIIFRYFNVAGHENSHFIGNRKKNPTTLIQKISKNYVENKFDIIVYGNNYGTRDGTCIRDYLHISDLVHAHYLALDFLNNTLVKQFEIFNVGYGRGISVLEIISLFQNVVRKNFFVEFSDKRAGDIAVSIANSKKIKRILKWDSQFGLNVYEKIIISEICWYQSLLQSTLIVN